MPPSPVESLTRWVQANYSEPLHVIEQTLKIAYVVLVFCSALLVGALKAVMVGPVAATLMILGNIGVILGLFPAHVAWTVYTLFRTNRIDFAFKLALLLALPILFGLWLALSIFGSVIVGLGYGFFTPWVSTFEAFRQTSLTNKFIHCLVDGTWGTIKGSCTVVRDFADICYHSFLLYLKELRENSGDNQTYSISTIEHKLLVMGDVAADLAQSFACFVCRTFQILNSDDHANYLKRQNCNPADYRPDIVHQDYFPSQSMNQTVRVVREKLDQIQSSSSNVEAGSASKKARWDNRRRISSMVGWGERL